MEKNTNNYHDPVDADTALILLTRDYASVEAQLRKEIAILKAQLLKYHQKVVELEEKVTQKDSKSRKPQDKGNNN